MATNQPVSVLAFHFETGAGPHSFMSGDHAEVSPHVKKNRRADFVRMYTSAASNNGAALTYAEGGTNANAQTINAVSIPLGVEGVPGSNPFTGMATAGDTTMSYHMYWYFRAGDK